MPELIVAINRNNGIGINNTIPWKCSEDLKMFKNKTMGHTIVVGRNTCDSLPKLKNRKVICISSHNYVNPQWKNEVTIINKLDQISESNEKIFIAGGEMLYRHALKRPKFISKIHLSVINNDKECDRYLNNVWLNDFIITERQINTKEWKHYILERKNSSEYQYLDLLKKIISTGKKRNGRNGNTLSLFVEHLTFNLEEGNDSLKRILLMMMEVCFPKK